MVSKFSMVSVHSAVGAVLSNVLNKAVAALVQKKKIQLKCSFLYDTRGEWVKIWTHDFTLALSTLPCQIWTCFSSRDHQERNTGIGPVDRMHQCSEYPLYRHVSMCTFYSECTCISCYHVCHTLRYCYSTWAWDNQSSPGCVWCCQCNGESQFCHWTQII